MLDFKIIALGGAGVSIVNNYIENYEDINTIVISPNIDDINFSNCSTKMLIGNNITNGLGCFGNPEMGRKAVEISKDEIEKVVKDTSLVILVAGLGGGNGTGEIEEIVKITNKLKTKTIAIVTFPFSFERKNRKDAANKCIQKIQNSVDEVIIIKNEELLQKAFSNSKSLMDAFRLSDKEAAKKIKEVIDKNI